MTGDLDLVWDKKTGFNLAWGRLQGFKGGIPSPSLPADGISGIGIFGNMKLGYLGF